MTARRRFALAGLALAVTLVAGRLFAGAYAEWAWYDALDAGSLWRVRLEALTTLRLGLFAIAFAFASANLLVMRRSIVSLVLPRQLGNLVIGEAVPGSTLTGAAVLLSLVIAAAMALTQDAWLVLLRAHWATPIGESDPYLGRDMAFWMGWLPLERSLHAWSIVLAVVVGATVLVLYALTPSLRVDHGRMLLSTRARRHFSVYTALLLLLVAWGYRIDAFDLLMHGTGIRETFVAFDHQVLYPYLIAAGFGTAAVALLVAWTGWRGQQRATLGALLLVLVAGPIGRVLLSVFDRRFAGDAERASLDRSYHRVRVLYTRRAYRVDDVLRGTAADRVRVGESRLATSVSGWDPAALSRALADEPGAMAVPATTHWHASREGRLQARVLLGTASSDASRLALALREADPTEADDRGAPWPVAAASASSVPPLSVGLGLVPVLPVLDTLGHVAAPPFPPGWRRVALAWSVRNLRLVAIESDDRRTRLLLRRDVRKRVQALLPFFTAGTTPQAMLVADSLWWTVELFNAGADYPLTEPLQLDGTLVRHAAPAGLALVNAHSGRVRVLLPERVDKVTRWWRDRLPELFVSPRALTVDALAALPAPVDRALVQGAALSRTGFSGDTLAARPLFDVDNADADVLPGAPAPFISGAAGAPLAWSVPVVDAADHVRGAFVALGGARPATALVEAADARTWSAILDQVQRTADSARIGASRPHPRHGRVQVIPTTNGLHVIQGFYDWPPDRAPSLAGVVALHGDRASVGHSLVVALGGPPHPRTSDQGLRPRLARLYGEMQDAMRRGDWVAFGRAMEALGRVARERP
ncbi:MAG: UPF0182 family protein [Gemmatimonadota bacterium]